MREPGSPKTPEEVTPVQAQVVQRLAEVRHRIRAAEARFGRDPGSVALLAVSKTRPAGDLRDALAAGQQRFGESYVQEAVEKVTAITDPRPEWHFIGRIQGNKTRLIAEHFDWVHSLDNPDHARRLSRQRPAGLPPLRVCLQVNVDQESSKGGVEATRVETLLEALSSLENLHLEGLMALPAPSGTLEQQRKPFARLRELRDRLAHPGLPLQTLSMGMSADLEAAIAEGATLVRVGTAIFGPRNRR